jgi:putative thiamine transport system substrate-binding protein
MLVRLTYGPAFGVRNMILRLLVLAALAFAPPALAQGEDWPAVLGRARGQTVHWNAWAGDPRFNDYIAWVGAEVERRFGVKVEHVRLRDTGEAVARVVAEKAAGRTADGSVDLIWINGPNLASMQAQALLYGPFVDRLPNAAKVDWQGKPSTRIDFTLPVGGMAAPWLMAQVVFVYDSARLAEPPASMAALADWARAHPGRLTHPVARNFLGATFLKQALVELAPDPAALQRPADDAGYAAASAPLWAWYEALRPALWRQGKSFPENEAGQRQLMADGIVDLYISFNPAEGAIAVARNELPPTTRSFVLKAGTIGNTSFVAIPYDATAKEGAMVVADFLLSGPAQARAVDPDRLGMGTVLDVAALPPAHRAAFAETPHPPALLTPEALGKPLLEPHPSWMTRITEEWERRTAR